jgi:hypothetical protein
MKTLLAAVMALTVSTSAYAESPYCIPKADGTDRIQKSGTTCPVGYFASGHCCEALHKDAPRAFPKIKGATCPSGTFTSSGYCKEYR